MAKERTYKSIEELLPDAGAPRAVGKAIGDHSISQALTVYRAKAGLTQKGLAAKMGVTEKAVARIEGTANDALKLGDIKAYAKALGYKAVLSFQEMQDE